MFMLLSLLEDCQEVGDMDDDDLESFMLISLLEMFQEWGVK